jgi:hypothetical protein
MPRQDDEILNMKSKWNFVSLKHLMEVVRFEIFSCLLHPSLSGENFVVLVLP